MSGTSASTTLHSVDSPNESKALAVRRWLSMWKLAFAVGTPTALFGGILMLFAYLAPIGRLDLLQSAVASPDGLALLVMWAVLVSLSLAIMFFGSLWFIDAAASIYSQSKRIPKGMPTLLAAGDAVWCVMFAAMLYLQTPSPNLWLAILSYFVLMVFCGARTQACAYQASRWQPKLRRAIQCRGASVGFLFAMAALLSLYAFLALLFVVPVIEQEAIGFQTVLLLVGTFAPTLFLGWAMFKAVARGRKQEDVRKALAFSVLGLTVVGLMSAASLVDARVLRALGVYSDLPERFVVASDDLIPSLKAAGFTVTDETGGAGVFSARVEFRFGDQLVLCATHEASPAPGNGSASTKAVKPMNTKGTPLSESSSNIPAGTSPIKVEPIPTETCLDMHTDDVRRLSKDRTPA